MIKKYRKEHDLKTTKMLSNRNTFILLGNIKFLGFRENFENFFFFNPLSFYVNITLAMNVIANQFIVSKVSVEHMLIILIRKLVHSYTHNYHPTMNHELENVFYTKVIEAYTP